MPHGPDRGHGEVLFISSTSNRGRVSIQMETQKGSLDSFRGTSGGQLSIWIPPPYLNTSLPFSISH